MNLNQIRRKVISPVVFLSVLAFTCIGGAVSAYGFMVSYKSRAVVFFEKSISDFRILEERLSTLNIFDRYQNGSKALLNLDAVEINTIRNQIVNPESWISPIFRLSKKDAKERIGLKDSIGFSDIVGYEIGSSSGDPEAARKKVDFLANYVSDASLKIQIDSFIADSLTAKRLLLTSATLERDTETYNLSLLEERLNDLRRLSRVYPTLAASADRQILNVEKNGERYMPLPMQMIAVERERFDIKEKLTKTQRRVEGHHYEEAMLAEHEKISQRINSGKELALALVKDIQARMPNAKQGYEMIALLGYEDKYATMVVSSLNPARFIVSPTLPIMPGHSPLKITILFGVLGGLLALLWQFRDWVNYMIKAIGAEENVDRTADSSLDANKGMHRV